MNGENKKTSGHRQDKLCEKTFHNVKQKYPARHIQSTIILNCAEKHITFNLVFFFDSALDEIFLKANVQD
jgi:hypothetical protein